MAMINLDWVATNSRGIDTRAAFDAARTQYDDVSARRIKELADQIRHELLVMQDPTRAKDCFYMAIGMITGHPDIRRAFEDERTTT